MATYYVATTGNDTTGDGSIGNPWLTVQKGLNTIASGDTLYMRAGTYGRASVLAPTTAASGTSWELPTTVAAYPGEVVILRRTAGTKENGILYFVGDTNGGQRYYVFDRLIIEGLPADGGARTYLPVYVYSSKGAGVTAPHHIRFSNCELRFGQSHGALVESDPATISTHIEFIKCSVHDNGVTANQDHGFYMQGQACLIDHCQIYNNFGLGIQIYKDAPLNPSVNNAQGNTVSNCVVYNNGRSGILLATGDGNIAFNNVCYGNDVGIRVDYGCDDALVYNNTCFNNTSPVGNNAQIELGRQGPVQRCLVTNNVCHHTDGSHNFVPHASTYTLKNNINVAAVDINAIDPLFKDAAGKDFHLTANSPCKGAGIDLSAAGITTDQDGMARPQGTTWDIGAFELSSNSSSSSSSFSSSSSSLISSNSSFSSSSNSSDSGVSDLVTFNVTFSKGGDEEWKITTTGPTR